MNRETWHMGMSLCRKGLLRGVRASSLVRSTGVSIQNWRLKIWTRESSEWRPIVRDVFRDADVALNAIPSSLRRIVADLGSQSRCGRPLPSTSLYPLQPFGPRYHERAKSVGLFQIPGRAMRFAGLVPEPHEWKRVRQDRWWGCAAFRGGLIYNRDVSNPTWGKVAATYTCFDYVTRTNGRRTRAIQVKRTGADS